MVRGYTKILTTYGYKCIHSEVDTFVSEGGFLAEEKQCSSRFLPIFWTAYLSEIRCKGFHEGN